MTLNLFMTHRVTQAQSTMPIEQAMAAVARLAWRGSCGGQLVPCIDDLESDPKRRPPSGLH